ncbi:MULTISPECIES: (4Fe-4S)-binding protein [unclassified Streptomyces]|uniref:(4Fe-4S)-binding protein n=1 Tax=unclassified Streptomyces TaxID=2593676 RepID=UPI002E814C33|nr:(4Fe-4S)-binding protein [Streptomyces sp. NBC_00589]WTI41821.1 (4Fe-4S)-binding protein [Streptomyces sp. NBC_00775]WUB24496.1 (4Fe-4S)-binding protein [Streptomyces sp. NBC_00589]
MSGRSEKKTYQGQSITVTFEAGRCLHAAECVHGLPEVFDTEKRPWIRPDGATAERAAEVVRRCPSGALQYQLADGGTESPDRPTQITRGSTGQLTVRGELSVDTPEGPRAETRVVLCGCGQSRLQPYCDHAGPCGE